MAKVIVTFTIMPESPEIDLEHLATQANHLIDVDFGPGDRKKEVRPIAFGLKAILLTFVMDEAKGGPDTLADKIAALEGVQSCEVTDVRRAIG